MKLIDVMRWLLILIIHHLFAFIKRMCFEARAITKIVVSWGFHHQVASVTESLDITNCGAEQAKSIAGHNLINDSVAVVDISTLSRYIFIYIFTLFGKDRSGKRLRRIRQMGFRLPQKTCHPVCVSLFYLVGYLRDSHTKIYIYIETAPVQQM